MTLTASEGDLSEEYSFGSREAVAEADDDTILSEIDEKRAEDTKHFHLDDGTFTAVTYAYPVHEQTDEGIWVEIDNTLEASGSDYVRNGLHDQVTFYGEPEDGRILGIENIDGFQVTGGIGLGIDAHIITTDTRQAHCLTTIFRPLLLAPNKIPTKLLWIPETK